MAGTSKEAEFVRRMIIMNEEKKKKQINTKKKDKDKRLPLLIKQVGVDKYVKSVKIVLENDQKHKNYVSSV